MTTETHTADNRIETNPLARALAAQTDGDDVADPSESEDNYHTLVESIPDRPLASEDHVGTMAGPAHDCGCGGTFCNASAMNLNMANVCDEPTVPTMNFARKQFQRLIQWGHDRQDGLGIERANAQYARLLHGDRRLQERYDDVTTILLTFRLSPTTDEKRLRPPLVMHDQLAGTWRKVYQRMSGRYGILDGYEYEYAKVYSGTETFATPHLHVLIHANDPDNGLTPNDFERTITAHTDEYEHAEPGHHTIHPDGDDGAVRLSHEPLSAVAVGFDRYLREDDPQGETVTAGAVYLASQIPRMLVRPAVKNDAQIERWKWHTATWGWASSKPTVGTSHGWPDRDT